LGGSRRCRSGKPTPLLLAVICKQNSPDAARKRLRHGLSPDALPHPYFFTRALFPVGAELSR